MKIAITVNGPGETAGWVRPVLRRLYDLDPTLEAWIFCVPDDYATGAEAATLRSWFPQAHVFDPQEYLRFAFGGQRQGVPESVDVVQYFGGDLMHAARISKRLGGIRSTFKFSRSRYAQQTQLACAVDEKNAGELEAWGVPQPHIHIVGNPAIDAAFDEALRADENVDAKDGIVILPGSRRYEVEHLIPFFFTMAVRIARENPTLPISMAISPFTPLDDVASAIAVGGDSRVFSQTGTLVRDGERAYLVAHDGSVRLPLVRNAMQAASRLTVTIPGTKVIELAALGVPTLAITPLNAPEKITINGPLTYMDRIPFFGPKLKAGIVLAVAKRFVYHTQPNIDAGEEIVRELHGTLTPGRVARVALELYADERWLGAVSTRLAGMYQHQRGAASRMATLIKSEV
ncbi:MAG: glycosyltransferase family protein [Vulcanimicrobiaceae bacterium]